jgi:hypothetical protein
MSLETLNRIFGEAIVNASFCRALLTDPGAAVRDYELGTDELELFSSIRAGSVDTLAQQVIAGLDLECRTAVRPPDPGGRTFGVSGGYGAARSYLQAAKAAAPPNPAATTAVFGKAMPLSLACWGRASAD